MNTTRKKILGIALIVMILAVIGSILVTAETEDMTTDEEPFGCFGFGRMMERPSQFLSTLTEEQQNEIDSIQSTMKQANASFEEIQEAINEKLREYGYEIPTRDELLQNDIERTTKRLEILERQKELRDRGTNWDDIKDIIIEEYGEDCIDGHGPGTMNHGFHKDRCRGGFSEDLVRNNGYIDI